MLISATVGISEVSSYITRSLDRSLKRLLGGPCILFKHITKFKKALCSTRPPQLLIPNLEGGLIHSFLKELTCTYGIGKSLALWPSSKQN